MNWLTKLVGLLPLIPQLVFAIEQVHGDAVAGATKKQMAMESLAIAGGVAKTVLPADAAAVDAATALVGNVIDGVVATLNAEGTFKKTAPAAPAAPLSPSPLRLAPAANPAPTPTVQLPGHGN